MSDKEPFQITTEVAIAATPETVWSQLTDFEAFASWNPFMIEVSGDPTLGSKLQVRMQPPGGSTMTFRPTVTEATAPNRFEWLGNLLFRGLFDGRHRFELESAGSGTRLVHSEQFTGILVPLMRKALETRTRAGFEAMNHALKERVESLQSS
ncbi:MAG TPA: SRPBCC domain-containing protein [Acidimicrobiia bacterium]|nr:SRPBCC domain-containing protein [Acidimicrobiia bacterium]